MLIGKTYKLNLLTICEEILEDREYVLIDVYTHELHYQVCARDVKGELDSIRVSETDLDLIYRWVLETVAPICIRKFGEIIGLVNAEINRRVNDPDTEADLKLERINLMEGWSENLECERK